MGAYNLTVNTDLLIDLPADFSDNGWTISGGKATHGGCNPGYIKLIDTGLLPNTSYVIKYEVSNYGSGIVKVIAGGVDGDDINTNGEVTEVITTGADTTLWFYADGIVTIEYLDYYTSGEAAQDNSLTLAFNENANKFVTYLSYKPELMIKFIDGFYTAKEGHIWEHNSKATRNNFYAEQFTSQITFYVNTNPTEIKNFMSMRQKSNKVWSVIEAFILPYYGKPNGQRSRLKKGRFKNLQGDWFAEFLKDQNDPRFGNVLEALFKGADLQGSILKITIENDEISEVRTLSMDFNCNTQNYTY